MFFPNRLVDHVPLAPLTCLTLLVYSPTALRTTPVRRALGVPAPPPVKPIYIRCLPSSPSVSPPTHRFVVSSGPLNSTSSKVCPPKRCVPASPRLGARASPGLVARLGAAPWPVASHTSSHPCRPHEPPPSTENQMAGAPAAPDRERLDRGGGGAALEQHVFRRVTWRLAPAPSCDAAAWLGPKPSSGILRGPGPRTRHPSTL
ncbi:WAS/WASL-interacting protein family member 2-like isoform X3 [Bos indicus]|uniref:WAS/WASL-interacting protein family member 2-like isoform X3 n=1 Tax=Bos indicus TaxID=9915 RepID=A0ABM4R8G4_BOSIN|nr:WAS/WASL-interacting protein family member 2-like isoform X4 [Bos indicus x Bos taurus]XP_027377622.1 WAS/WASL-interacting protein family member 2-like isoform X4 [Bos indicus x Bos taurus]